MRAEEEDKFISLIKKLPGKKQKEFYYMVMGALLVAEKEKEN